MRLRTRIFVAMAGVAVVALAATLAIARADAQRRAEERIAERFARASENAEQLERRGEQQVLREVAALARSHPLFRTVLSNASLARHDLGFGGRPSADDVRRDANLRLRSLLPSAIGTAEHDVVVVASANGELLYDRQAPGQYGDDLSGLAVLRDSVADGVASSFWARASDLPVGLRLVPDPLPGPVYRVAAAPVVFGDMVHGFVVLGDRIGLDELASIRRLSAVDVALLDGTRWLASTLPADRAGAAARHLDARGVPAASGRPPVAWELDGERILVARTPLDRDGRVSLLALQSLDAELADLRELERSVALVGLVALAIAIMVSALLSSGLTRTVRALHTAAQRIGRGDLDVSLDSARGDELGELAAAFDDMAAGLRERDRVRRALDRHVSRRVADEILRRGADLSGTRRELTLLFVDLAGFTAMAEGSPPERVMQWLGEYVDVVSELVEDEDGTVSELWGDGLLAFWNAPLPQPDHAVRACRAATRIGAALETLQTTWRERGAAAAGFRIGLHTGPVLVGELESRLRTKYAAVGDAINLASRIESAGRFYGCPIVVSGETRALVGDAFAFRRLESVRVAGRTAPVDLHELLGPAGDVAPERVAFARRYEAALEQLERKPDQAEPAWRALADEAPDDAACARLLQRARAAAEAPETAGPDGIVDLAEK